MHTALSPEFANSARGRRAGEILRKCVHCGFCNAACPTYQLLGDELDGPRGRIYQMKQFFEGAAAGDAMRLHLDRCLLCRSCETACPSGVQYGELLEIGRAELEEKLPRRAPVRAWRVLLGRVFSSRKFFSALMRVARACKWALPKKTARMIPAAQSPTSPAPARAPHERKMLALAGCVQPALSAGANPAAARVLDQLGITLFEEPAAGCCGAVQLHTSDLARGKAAARALMDRWLPHLEHIEAVVMTASGCGLTIKEYPLLFADEPEYAEKARRIADKTLDLCEVVARELPRDWTPRAAPKRVAFHAPCTLQHGRRISGVIEELLRRAGHEVCEVHGAHLCCGSAGTYSLLQPEIAARLRRDKLAALGAGRPQVICTANVGCQNHLAAGADIPVVHWIELL
ncbi:MAG: glycolate oxidase subunit GlcF [Gammaproteobacteria bacterium]|nr:glycolate oxidase subunit GlcF [Gammaproteobacteria bacterium]